MSRELPNGWLWSTIGEVCHNPQYGWTTKASKTGSLRIVRTTDITSGAINWDTVPFCEKEPKNKEKYLLKDGDIVISRAGSVGYSLLIKSPQHSVFASYLIRFIPIINENFVAYFLKSPYYWNSISETKIGIAVPNVNATKLKKISVPIAPLNEQHRIIAKIEELFTKLDAGIKALKNAQAQLKRYRQSVLKAAVEGRLTAEWREQHLPASPCSAQASEDELEPADKLLTRILKERREKWEAEQLAKYKSKGKKLPKNWQEKYKESTPPDTTNLPELPEGWVWTTLGNITQPSKEKVDPKKIDELTYIGLEHIEKQTGKLLDSGLSSEVRSTKSKFSVGDLLYGKLRPYLNKVYVAEFDGICSTDILVFKPSIFVKNKFLQFYMLRDDFVRYANLNVSGVHHPRVNFKVLSEFLIALPSKNEQKKIIDIVINIFSVIDKIELELNVNIQKSDNLRHSILKRAFKGKLVSQDPNDLPASVLLKRIKAEEAKYKKSKQMEIL